MSPDEFIRNHVWLPVLIGVGGGVIIIFILTVLGLAIRFCCLRKGQRRRHGSFYANAMAFTEAESSFSYGSTSIRTSSPESQVPSPPGGGNVQRNMGGTRQKREMGLYEAMEYSRRKTEMSDRESMRLICQFYLRNTQRYMLFKTLPELGSRMRKYWFLVSPVVVPSLSGAGSSWGGTTQHLMTLLPTSKHCSIRLQGQSLTTLNKLLKALQHPYIHAIQEVDFILDKECVTMFQHFIPHGSLKDHIYKTEPEADWSTKYSVRKKGLSHDTVALFGRQILEALLFLYARGFPPLGHVHSGNVLVNSASRVCQLSGYENTLLGYRTRTYNLFEDHLPHIDIIMFGHLVFEMACGFELTSMAPTEHDLRSIKHEHVKEVLNFIFFYQKRGMYPTIRQIADLPYFQGVVLPQLSTWEPPSQSLTSEQRTLLRMVRRGRPVTTELERGHGTRQSGKKSPGDGVPQKSLRPPHQHASSPRSSTLPSGQSTTVTPPPTAPRTRTQSLPRPVARSSQPPGRPPSASERVALLGDIRHGKDLSKTVTDDRSAPRI